jgi:hypothetical protein
VFLTQLGIVVSATEEIVVDGTSIILFETSHWTAWTNVFSSIVPSAHHPAVFFIQPGTLLEVAT